MRSYYLTRHAVERFKERCRGKVNGVDWNDFLSIKIKMYKMVNESKEDRSYLNNFRLMEHIYEKYGYDYDFKILRHTRVKALTFVLVRKRDKTRDAIVTCYFDAHDKYMTHHNKYKRNKRKRNDMSPELMILESMPADERRALNAMNDVCDE